MKKTGRVVTLSGFLPPGDFDADSTIGGIKEIYLDERQGYGYRVTKFTTFPNAIMLAPAISGALSGVAAMNLYTYDARELREIDAQSGNALLAILGQPVAAPLSTGNMLPPNNDRCIATFAPMVDRSAIQTGYNGATAYEVVKKNNFVVQALSIGFQENQPCAYYIEMDEYEITPDEEVLLLLQQKGQVVGPVSYTGP